MCSEPITDPVLDHDHKTGLIRACLCRQCNLGLGKIEKLTQINKFNLDDLANFLNNTVQYLKTHSLDQTGLLHPTFKTEEEKRLRRNKQARKRYKNKKSEE